MTVALVVQVFRQHGCATGRYSPIWSLSQVCGHRVHPGDDLDRN